MARLAPACPSLQRSHTRHRYRNQARFVRLLTELARGGVTVVMLSTELDEHVQLMDRVLVFREHQLRRDIASTDLTRKAILSAFFDETQKQS